MPKKTKSILKKRNSPNGSKSPRNTRKKRVKMVTDWNEENIIEKLFSDDNKKDLWITSDEKKKAEIESNIEEIRELGEHNYYAINRNKLLKRKKHIENILPNINKEIRLRNVIPKLAANEARIKLKIDDDGSPRITLKRSKSSRWGGNRSQNSKKSRKK